MMCANGGCAGVSMWPVQCTMVPYMTLGLQSWAPFHLHHLQSHSLQSLATFLVGRWHIQSVTQLAPLLHVTPCSGVCWLFADAELSCQLLPMLLAVVGKIPGRCSRRLRSRPWPWDRHALQVT